MLPKVVKTKRGVVLCNNTHADRPRIFGNPKLSIRKKKEKIMSYG